MYKHPIAFLSVNNLTTARYAAAMMLDYIGFCFDPAQEKYITVEKAKEIMGWLSGVKFIGEFYSRPADEINAIAMELNLEMVLMYGDYSETDIGSIPFKKILTVSRPPGNYLLADEQILDAARNIFALPFYSHGEDETGLIDFSEITAQLNALEE